MRRGFCLLLTVIMLLCSAAQAEASEVDELLDQLSKLLDQRESLYELRSDTYDALKTFGEQNDYPSLLIARITCDAGLQSLALVPKPELTISDDALAALLRSGVEAASLEEEFRAAPEMTALIDLSMYESFLYMNVYQLSMLDAFRDWIAINRRSLELGIAYDGKMVNNLLLPIADDPTVEAFWNAIPERWPLIGGGLSAWEEDMSVLYSEGAAILAELNSLVDETAEVSGRDNYAYERFTDHLANRDFEALRADANPIADMPVMIPLPEDWLMPEDTQLFAAYDEGDEDGLPSVLMMRDTTVAAESFHAYVETLESLNIPLYRSEGSDEEGWKIIFAMDDRILMLEWYPSQVAMVVLDPRELTLEEYTYVLCVMT